MHHPSVNDIISAAALLVIGVMFNFLFRKYAYKETSRTTPFVKRMRRVVILQQAVLWLWLSITMLHLSPLCTVWSMCVLPAILLIPIVIVLLTQMTSLRAKTTV